MVYNSMTALQVFPYRPEGSVSPPSCGQYRGSRDLPGCLGGGLRHAGIQVSTGSSGSKLSRYVD